MGLTYGCARCHNHKFDPILQADYYRLQAFFANTAANDHIPMLRRRRSWPNTGASGRFGKRRPPRSAPRWRRCSSRIARKRPKDYFDKYPPEIQAMILKPAAERTPYETQMCGEGEAVPGNGRTRCRQAAEGRGEEAVRRAEGGTGDSSTDINPGELPGGHRHGGPEPQRACHARAGGGRLRSAEGRSAARIPDAARSRRRRRSCRRRMSNPRDGARRWRNGSPIRRIR